MKGHWLLWANIIVLIATLYWVHWHVDQAHVQWGDGVCIWGAGKVEGGMPRDFGMCGIVEILPGLEE